MTRVVSQHKDRLVCEEGGRYVKRFRSKRDCRREVAQLERLASLGIGVPRIVATGEREYVTERLAGMPLDEFLRDGWGARGRAERSALISRVADLCRRIRDAGLDWPDLVTYHIWVDGANLAVLDPARLRRGRLDLSPLYWSAEEPTVSKSDRLRFWRAYAGSAPPPRPRRIGHRGRFRPYRWVLQRSPIKACPPWSDFVDAVGSGYASCDALLGDPALVVRRTLPDRVNAVVGDLVVKVVADAREAEREWENHRMMMASGFAVPQPAVGGRLADGRGLFSTVRLKGLAPLDDRFSTLDRRRAALDVADLVRRLHACGLVHRDLYLCHLFIAPGGRALTLIDLARLKRSRSRRLRVKDLAALVMSGRGRFTRADLLRGLRRYGGDARLCRDVGKKAAKMARHVPRNVRDGTHVPHVPCTSDS